MIVPYVISWRYKLICWMNFFVFLSRIPFIVAATSTHITVLHGNNNNAMSFVSKSMNVPEPFVMWFHLKYDKNLLFTWHNQIIFHVPFLNFSRFVLLLLVWSFFFSIFICTKFRAYLFFGFFVQVCECVYLLSIRFVYTRVNE